MRVSVVVAVFNPGRYFSTLIDSLKEQSLPTSDWEAIFVDDGSTDGTSEELDRLVANRANFHVIHQPNSGWPGQPRNVGMRAARGEFTYLVDHDDRLDPRAIEALVSFAETNELDVVVGKIEGVGRNAPKRIFERTRVDAKADLPLLFSSLTPQKLYRTSFLREQGIDFPEGRRRLEDHLFVTKAYLRAQKIGVFADFTTYYFLIRDDGQNASRRRPVWKNYFANAADSIRVVDEEVADADLRLKLRQRWLRQEALSRLRGRGAERSDLKELVAAVRTFMVGNYTLSEIDNLSPRNRLICYLVLDSNDEAVREFGEWERNDAVLATFRGITFDGSTRALEFTLKFPEMPVKKFGAKYHELVRADSQISETRLLKSRPSVTLSTTAENTDSIRLKGQVWSEDSVVVLSVQVDEALEPGVWAVDVALDGLVTDLGRKISNVEVRTSSRADDSHFAKADVMWDPTSSQLLVGAKAQSRSSRLNRRLARALKRVVRLLRSWCIGVKTVAIRGYRRVRSSRLAGTR